MPISEYVQPALTFGGTAAGAFGLWHANRTKSRMDAQNEQRDDVRADAELVDARWQAMFEHQRSQFEALLAPMATRIDQLETKVKTLELAHATLNSRHRIAIDHIRQTHRWADGDRVAPFPPIPTALLDEV